MDMQIRSLKKGVHIVVATPGRLIDLMNRGKLVLDGVSTVVILLIIISSICVPIILKVLYAKYPEVDNVSNLKKIAAN